MKKIFLNKNFQVLYGLILIILVPTVVVVNTLALNRSFKTNIDIQLQRQALSLGRSFNLIVENDLEDEERLQQAIIKTVNLQADVRNIKILKFQGEDFLVVANSIAEQIGKTDRELENFVSWHQNQAIATMAVLPEADYERFWLVAVPLYDNNGEKQYLLNMSISLELMDELIRSSLTRSYIFLSLTVLILILLLAANTRMFEYAVLYRKIKEVNTMKDEFISIASHELRTPLTVIKGYTYMLLTDKTSKFAEKSKDALKTIYSSSERLAELVEDLLNVSRIEQNRITLNIEMIDPMDIAKEIVGEFQNQAESKGLSFELTTDQKLPHLLTDRKRLKQVLVNIVGNAIKYTMKGSIKMSVAEKRGFIIFTITDTGIGISTKDRERLFEKFYRVKDERARDVSGTGLGLWITKKIVEMLSGKIVFDSIPGIGSQVSVQLPLKKK